MGCDLHPDANLIGAYLEGGLSRSARRALTRHLSECSQCRSWTALAAASVAPLPVRMRGWSSSWLGYEPWAVAASVLLLAGGLWIAYTPLTAHAPSEPVAVAQAAASAAAPVRQTTAPIAPGKRAVPARARHTAFRRQPPATAPALPPAAGLAAAQAAFVVPEFDAPAAAVADDTASAEVSPPAATGSGEFQPSIDFSPLMTGFQDQVPLRATRTELAAWTTPATAQTAGGDVGLPLNAPLATSFAAEGGGSMPAASLSGPLAPALSAGLGWAISRSGQVLRSIGTDMWAAVPLVPGLKVHAMAVTQSLIWAGGRADQLFVSADHGGHWREVKLPGVGSHPAELRDIQFSDARHGVVIAASGAVWRTSDGGATWSSDTAH